MDSQLKKGILEVCVLAALREEESYGYKIIGDLSPYIAVSESTLYPILKRLEAGQSVTTSTREYGGRLRKYYKITTAGLDRIADFSHDVEELNKVYQFIYGGTR